MFSSCTASENKQTYIFICPMLHALTHTHLCNRPLQENTHKVHASLKLPSQHSSLTAFGCHEDDEVRGLGAEFDPDWQRQRWHNLYQSTSLLLDSFCLSVCVSEMKCECKWFSVALLLCMPVCVCVGVCPGHIIARRGWNCQNLERFFDICFSAYMAACTFVCTAMYVCIWEIKLTQRRDRYILTRGCVNLFAGPLSSLRIHTASPCQKRKHSRQILALSKHFHWVARSILFLIEEDR